MYYAGTLRIVYVEVDVVDAISGEPLLIVVGLICSDECFDLVFIEDRNNVFRRMVDIALFMVIGQPPFSITIYKMQKHIYMREMENVSERLKPAVLNLI